MSQKTRNTRHGTKGTEFPSRVGLATIAMLLTACCHATTFYIDNASGADSNDGTSPGHAWATPEPLESGKISAGDHILFHDGQAWEGYSIRLEVPGITIGRYSSTGRPNSSPPVLRSASTLEYEPLKNKGFETYTPNRQGNADFEHWKENTPRHSTITPATDTPSGRGVSALMKSNGKGRPRLTRLTPKPLAARAALTYSFQAKVISGTLLVQLRNTATGRYLDEHGNWIIVPAFASRVSARETPHWEPVSIAFIADNRTSQYEFSISTSGSALVDDFNVSSHWSQVSPGIYRRAVITSPALEVYGVYIGDAQQARKLSIAELANDGDWYWDKAQRALYLKFTKGAETLRQIPIRVNRARPILIDLAAPGISIDGLVIEEALEGVRIRADQCRILNSTLRNLERYSIHVAEYQPKRDIERIVVRNNVIHDAGNGPYLVNGNFCIVADNHIYNIRDRGTIADNEAIPIMGGHDNLFENNHIHDSWLGIDLWGRPDRKGEPFSSAAYNNVVRFNRIHNIDKYGIVIGGTASPVSLDSKSFGKPCSKPLRDGNCAYRSAVYNNYIHHNVIYDSGFAVPEGSAIRQTKAPLTMPNYIFNNTLNGNRISFSGETFSGGFIFAFNASVNPHDAHLHFPGKTNTYGNLSDTELHSNHYSHADQPDVKRCAAKFVWRGFTSCNVDDFLKSARGNIKGTAANHSGSPNLNNTQNGSTSAFAERFLENYPKQYLNSRLRATLSNPPTTTGTP